jgi:hypothetical protein
MPLKRRVHWHRREGKMPVVNADQAIGARERVELDQVMGRQAFVQMAMEIRHV